MTLTPVQRLRLELLADGLGHDMIEQHPTLCVLRGMKLVARDRVKGWYLTEAGKVLAARLKTGT